MKRSLVDLKPHEVLRVAVWIEERNARAYENYAEMFEWYEPEITQAFLEMAAEEREHGERLQAVYKKRYGDLVCNLTDSDITEIVEAPMLEDGETFIHNTTRRRDVLEVGLKAERFAQAFYSRLAETTEDDEQRALYAELAGVETEHEAFLLKKIAELEGQS
jgi:erythrin-vacuolar iron transport family protein